MLESIGIEPKLILAQAINFALLLFVLYKFLYGPILKMLSERAKKIEQSLKDAEEMKKRLDSAKQESDEIIAAAKIEAKKVIEEARGVGEDIKATITKEAELKAKEIIENSRELINTEREKALKEMRGEMAGFVSQALKTIINKDSAKYDDALIHEAVADLAKVEG